MKMMKLLLSGVFYVTTVVLLMLTFRVDEYLSNFNFGRWTTVGSYFLLALLVTIVAMCIAPFAASYIFNRQRSGDWREAIVTAIVCFLVLCLIGVSFGPLGVDFPGLVIRAIFFAEWKFLNFIVYTAVLLSVIAGVFRRLEKH